MDQDRTQEAASVGEALQRRAQERGTQYWLRHRLNMAIKCPIPGPAATQVRRRQPQPPKRNDPCPCKSGKKFKACCGVLTRTGTGAS